MSCPVTHTNARHAKAPAPCPPTHLHARTQPQVWGRKADTNIAAVLTLSPTLHEGVLYTGISSLEENVAAREPPPLVDRRGAPCYDLVFGCAGTRQDEAAGVPRPRRGAPGMGHSRAPSRRALTPPCACRPLAAPAPRAAPAGQSYECCTFRGSVVALDAKSGSVKWQTFTTPAAPPGVNQTQWWSGAAVWVSAGANGGRVRFTRPLLDTRWRVPVATGICNPAVCAASIPESYAPGASKLCAHVLPMMPCLPAKARAS